MLPRAQPCVSESYCVFLSIKRGANTAHPARAELDCSMKLCEWAPRCVHDSRPGFTSADRCAVLPVRPRRRGGDSLATQGRRRESLTDKKMGM